VLISWLRYLRRLRPDKVILAEGRFRELALGPVLASFVVTRGNVWLMQLHPPPLPTKENSPSRWGLLPFSLRERARVWLIRGVLSVSQGVKDRLVRMYSYPTEKVEVVFNGVDAEHFVPASEETRRALRRDLQIADDAVVVVSTARLDRTKRLERLIEAFGAVSTKRKDIYLLLTGEGPERDRLERIGRSVDNCDNIRFLGYVADVSEALQASDIYILPSDEEAFGIALVEAMSCELVCVATKTVGPSEIIEDGVNGFLTDVSYDGVLNGLQRALQLEPKERQTLGRRARQKVLAHFRVENSVTKALRFLEIGLAKTLTLVANS
jgi:L-malate glycosyltransferase